MVSRALEMKIYVCRLPFMENVKSLFQVQFSAVSASRHFHATELKTRNFSLYILLYYTTSLIDTLAVHTTSLLILVHTIPCSVLSDVVSKSVKNSMDFFAQFVQFLKSYSSKENSIKIIQMNGELVFPINVFSCN